LSTEDPSVVYEMDKTKVLEIESVDLSGVAGVEEIKIGGNLIGTFFYKSNTLHLYAKGIEVVVVTDAEMVRKEYGIKSHKFHTYETEGAV